jgi:hypothetical protein
LELRSRAEGFSLDRFREGFLALVDELVFGVTRTEGSGL